MIKLTSFLVVMLLAFSPAVAQDSATSIAKVDYSEIEDLVEAVVLSRPENKELGERFKSQEAKAQESQKQMQQAIMAGEKIDLRAAGVGAMGRSKESKEVNLLCEKYLLEVIEKLLGDKYQVVLKDNYRSSLLYTKIAIDDVTVLVRQELLKQLPVEKPTEN